MTVNSSFGLFKDLQPKLKEAKKNNLTTTLDNSKLEARPGILFKECSEILQNQFKQTIMYDNVPGVKSPNDVIALLLDLKYRKYTRIVCFHLCLFILWRNNTLFMRALAKKPFDNDTGLPTISDIQELLYTKVPKEFYLLPSSMIPPSFLETILSMVPSNDFNNITSFYNIQSSNKQDIIEMITEWIYLPISKSIVFNPTRDLLFQINKSHILPFPANFNTYPEYQYALSEHIYISQLYLLQFQLQALLSLLNPQFINQQITCTHWHINLSPISTFSKPILASKSFLSTELDVHINLSIMSSAMYKVWNNVYMGDMLILLTFGESNYTFTAICQVVQVVKMLNSTECVFKLRYQGKPADRYDALYYGGHDLYHSIHALEEMSRCESTKMKQFILHPELAVKDTIYTSMDYNGISSLIKDNKHMKIALISNNEDTLTSLLKSLSEDGHPCCPCYTTSNTHILDKISYKVLSLKNRALQLCHILEMNNSHCHSLTHCITFIRYHVIGTLNKMHSDEIQMKLSAVDADKLGQLKQAIGTDVMAELSKFVDELQLYEPCDGLLSSDAQKYDYYMKHCGMLYLIKTEYVMGQIGNVVMGNGIEMVIYDGCEEMGELAFVKMTGMVFNDDIRKIVINHNGELVEGSIMHRILNNTK